MNLIRGLSDAVVEALEEDSGLPARGLIRSGSFHLLQGVREVKNGELVAGGKKFLVAAMLLGSMAFFYMAKNTAESWIEEAHVQSTRTYQAMPSFSGNLNAPSIQMPQFRNLTQ